MPNRAGAAVLLLVAWLTGSAFAGGVTSPSNADCDGAAWQRVMAAETERQRLPDARGIWRDGRSLVWPARASGGTVWLLGSHAKLARGVALRAAADGTLHLPPALGTATLREALRGPLWLEHRDADGRPLARTGTQIGAALDALYAPAEQAGPLGATVHLRRGRPATQFAVWAPTARAVALCLHERPQGGASRLLPMRRDARTGLWTQRVPADLSGRSYTYLVDVTVRGRGLVRNRVTDPYSLSLTADSRRTWIADLNHPALKPPGWDEAAAVHRRVHARAPHPVDMRIYELHVRDFSASDASVPQHSRGKYLAFTEAASDGMRHLAALSEAGITDLHLLPVFDIATIPEVGCVESNIPEAAADSPAQQAAVAANTARDCFNWGYDPFHFGAPEGSYASDAMDGARRIVEFRAMVLALHRAGLRVGMDVVYNHTTASGQQERSVLDRIVPGYYQRYDAAGRVETSTCCANTATERRMMGRLMVDTLLVWARDHRIDSFRFDLMGHQPRALMEQAQARLRRELGREIHFIGEGWNFGEVADNARFRQASQLELNGSGIATFSDRMRDAARGGGHDDSAERLVMRQGWLNGLHLVPNEGAAPAGETSRNELLRSADLLRLGLAGTLRGYRFQNHDNTLRRGDEMRYGSQIAGYASQPGEVVNYVENHDNQMLWDINALRLPRNTSAAERARVQMLGAALVAYSQGVAYFHAGMEALRSKSLDRNSYDSGDWFNRIDWRFQTNHFGSGLPPEIENGKSWAVMRPFLADRSIAPGPAELAWTRATFADLLRLRTSSSLFRLRSAEEVQRRLTLLNTGPAQNPALLVTSLDGHGLDGAGFSRIVTFINTHPQAQTLRLPELAGQPLVLHPVHRAATAGDRRPRDEARFDAANGEFVIPGRTALAYVLD